MVHQINVNFLFYLFHFLQQNKIRKTDSFCFIHSGNIQSFGSGFYDVQKVQIKNSRDVSLADVFL